MISILHPTRSRPIKSVETIGKWINRCYDKDNIEVIVSVDSDDREAEKYKQFYHSQIIELNNNRSAIDAINAAAKRSIGNILIVVSDDTDCPIHWDTILLDAISCKKDFVLKVWDGIQKRIVTMPIMDRAFYNRFGYVYNPIYKHSWCDTELTEVADRLGRLIIRNDIEFLHLHPSVTGEVKDDLYIRNDKTHDEYRAIYEERKRNNFYL